MHVFVADDEFRINLLTGKPMDEVPAGQRRKVMKLFRDNVELILEAYERHHPQSD